MFLYKLIVKKKNINFAGSKFKKTWFNLDEITFNQMSPKKKSVIFTVKILFYTTNAAMKSASKNSNIESIIFWK